MPGYERREFAAAPTFTPPAPRPAHDRRIYLLAAMLVLGVVGLIASIVMSDRGETDKRAVSSLTNLANALEKSMGGDIELWDRSLQATADALRLPGLAQADPAVRRAALFGPATGAGTASSMLVLDAEGNIVAASGTAMPQAGNLADRPFYTVLRDHPDLGLFVSEPFQSRFTGETVIVFARRFDTADGRFGGVVGTSVDTSYFRQLFAQLDLGENGAISLFRRDGALLARYPVEPAKGEHAVAGAQLLSEMLRAPSGVGRGVSSVDHVARIYAFRRVGSLPLLVTVSNGRAAVFAAWQRKTAVIVTSVAILLALTGVLLVGLRRQFHRRAAAEARALASADVARRSERTLALALAQLDTVFRYSADAHFAASRRADGRFALDMVNHRAEELVGIRAEAIIGRTPDEFLAPAVAHPILECWDRCLHVGEPISYEQEMVRPSGDRVCWETHLVPVHDTAGALCRLIGTARDITERKTAQADAFARAASAERMQALGQLASGIAHDVNNVLQSVAGGAEMVERRADEPHVAKRAARMIADAAARGASITHRLLTFSRQDNAAPERIPVAPVLADLGEILRHTLRGGGRIDIRVECEDEALTAFADRNQLQTVLLNLATNARDAMPAGGTLVLGASAAAAPPDLPADSYVRLWVQDDGSGIDPAILARVTKPFFTTKPVGEGTGLGLSMADAFARELGGKLVIDSLVGHGTTVTLVLRR